MALTRCTMNSSMTPLMPSGSSFCTSSSSSVFSSSRWAKHTAGVLTEGWVPLSFQRGGGETSHLGNWLFYQWFGSGKVPWSPLFQLLSQPADSQSMSSPVAWPSVIWAAHHRNGHASTQLHNQEGSALGMKQPKLGGVLINEHTSPIQFLFPPSTAGTILDLGHPMP